MSICLKDFYASVGDVLSKVEANKIAKRLLDRAKERKISNLEGHVDSMNGSLQDELDHQQRQVLQAKRETLINLKIKRDIETRLRNSNNAYKEANEYLTASETGVKASARVSVENQQKSRGLQLMGKLTNDLLKNNLDSYFMDENNANDIANSVMKTGEVKNPQAHLMGKSITSTMDYVGALYRKYGVDIGHIDGYIAKQTHDLARIQSATGNFAKDVILKKALQKKAKSFLEGHKQYTEMAFERWKNSIKPLLRDDVYGSENPDKFLRAVFDHINIGNDMRDVSYDPNQNFKRPINFAAKIAQKRVLHFKDGTSLVKYNRDYGTGSFHSMVWQGLQRAGHNIGLLEKMGPNPEMMFNHLKTMAKQIAINEHGIDPASVKSTYKLDSKWFQLTGKGNIPGNVSVARVDSNIRAWIAMTRLGKLPLISLTDMVPHAYAAFRNNVSYSRAYSMMIKNLFRGKASKEVKMASNDLGLAAKNIIGHLALRANGSETLGRSTAKWTSRFYKYTGQDYLDSAFRDSQGFLLARNLHNESDKAFDGIPDRLKTSLKMYDIGSKEWDLIRSNDLSDKTKMLTAEMANHYSPESIANYLGKDVDSLTQRDIANVRDQMNVKLINYFSDHAAHGTFEPNAADRAQFYGMTQPGTLPGIATRMIGQFKMFMWAWTKRFLGRAVMNDKAQILPLTLQLAAVGFAAQQLEYLGKGQIPPNPFESVESFKQTMEETLSMSGIFGLFNSFVFSNASSPSDYIVNALGPEPGTAANLATGIGKVISNLTKEGGTPGFALFQLIKNNIPFLNNWYTAAALNYLMIYGIQEALNPGYLDRMKSYQEQNGAQFMVNPNNNLVSNLMR